MGYLIDGEPENRDDVAAWQQYLDDLAELDQADRFVKDAIRRAKAGMKRAEARAAE